MFLGKGGTHTKSLVGPHKKPLHCIRSRDLGGQFLNEESACPLDKSCDVADAHLGVHVWLYANGEVPHSAGRNFHSSSIKQGTYLCDSNSHSKLYISESVYFFYKNQVHFKNIDSSYIMFLCHYFIFFGIYLLFFFFC